MARRGRRLTIGGSGIGLADDDSLSQTGVRGEVNRYAPPSEDVAAQEASRLALTEPGTPADEPIVMTIPPESGGGGAASEDGSAGPGGGSDTGGGADAGVEHKGGLIERDETAKLQKGEFVITRAMVKKYGERVLKAINSGKAKIENGNEVEIPKRRMRGIASRN